MLLEVYIAFVSITISILFLSWFTRKPEKKDRRIKNNELTVIIPFRNEEKNLDLLLASLSRQTILPKSIIFVDDHSEDKGPEKVKTFCNQNGEAVYLKLQEHQRGKKKAIDLAINAVSTKFVMTLDADTWFENEFFSSISNDTSSSMNVRPVVLKANSIIQEFYALEHLFLSSFNYLIFPVHPLTASGANLIYKKDAYLNFYDIQSHKHISSGDDHFFLKRLSKNKQPLSISNQIKDTVYTEAPNSLKDYLSQRVRWLSKTMVDRDFKDFLIGFYFTLYLIGGFVLFIYLLVQQNYMGAGILLLVRSTLDCMVLLPYVIPLKETKNILLLPIQQLIQPLLLLIVMLASVTIKPKWKGRNIR